MRRNHTVVNILKPNQFTHLMSATLVNAGPIYKPTYCMFMVDLVAGHENHFCHT